MQKVFQNNISYLNKILKTDIHETIAFPFYKKYSFPYSLHYRVYSKPGGYPYNN